MNDITPPRRQRALGILSGLGIAVATVLVALWVCLTVWPYDDLRISQPGGVVSNERTADGIAVVRTGSTLVYPTDFLCNDGVDVTSTRYLDAYGGSPPSDVVTPVENRDARTASQFLNQTTFYVDEAFCVDDILVNVPVPSTVESGLYRLRTVNEYEPNGLTSRDVTTETDLMVILQPGEPVPE